MQLKTFIANFFRDGTSESMVRLLSFMCVVTACILAFSHIGDKLTLIGIFLGAGLTSKVGQKIIEMRKGV